MESQPGQAAPGAPAAWHWTTKAAWGAASVALLVAALAVSAAMGQDDLWGGLLSAVGQAAISMAAAVASWRARKRVDDRQAKGWATMALASGSPAAITLAAVAVILLGGPELSGWPLLILFAAVNLAWLVALVLLRPPAVSGKSGLRFALDALICAGSLFFLLWAGIEGGHGPPPPGLGVIELGMAVGYPTIDAAALAILLLSIAHMGRRTPPWFAMLAASTVLLMVTDSVAGYLTLRGSPLAGLVADGGYLMALAWVVLAARLAQPWATKGPLTALASPQPRKGPRFATQWAAYVPFVLAVLAAPYDYLENDGLEPILFITAIVVVLIATARTLVLLMENRDLMRELEATDAYKLQLLRFISHEMANPLSPLKLQLALLRRRHPPAATSAPSGSGLAALATPTPTPLAASSDSPVRDPDAAAWSVVDRSLDRLDLLSRDVRLLALSETGKLVHDPTPTDLGAQVQAAVESALANASAKGILLDASTITVGARLDVPRFAVVLDNLLSNALKFTPQGGAVHVTVADHEGLARIAVHDTGAGMTAQQQSELFRPFSRLDSTQPGLGLGLYLCKGIVEAHGGRIGVSSPGEGLGSTFWVELPRVELDGNAGAASSTQGPARFPDDLRVSLGVPESARP